ncbi:hypothetical protein MMC31_007455, partial [Peltigera leucophlebia]|nr:hypothetical protein [Peltigera leucophlebia]
MSQQTVYLYLSFTARTIGLVHVEDIPQTLENRIITRFGNAKFIRGLTEPLQLSLNAATKLYGLQFKLTEEDSPPSSVEMIQENFRRLGEIWTKLEEDLQTFAREEENAFPIILIPSAAVARGLIVPHTRSRWVLTYSTSRWSQRRIFQESKLEKSLHHQNSSELLDFGLR